MDSRFLSSVLLVLFTLALVATLQATEEKYAPTWDSLDRRPIPAWFNEAKFGIFVVWGPYSIPAYVDHGYSEWYRWRLEDKTSDTWKFHVRNYGEDFAYEDFAPLLKAEMWDPDFWADLFVKSGARYVVTTANYHDGFCLYPSAYDATTRTDQWNSTEVGPMRDLLGELNTAGRARGLRMGIYYSLYEWFHPLWIEDRDRYAMEKFHPQFKEVVTGYKPDIIFLDGDWDMDHKRWRSEELAAWLYNESPVGDYVVVNDRWGQVRRKHGDCYSSEYGGGNFPPTHPWEENRGIGHSYGYNRNETIYDYDSEADLIRMLSKICGNGGNFLLDVGPTADGRIPVIMQERLLQIGAWLETNGEAIYGSRESPFWPRRFAWGTCTRKPGRIFVHLHERPGDQVVLPGLQNKVIDAVFLGDVQARSLLVTHEEQGVTIGLPARLPQDTVSVIALTIEGEPEMDATIRPSGDGSLLLHACEARLHGETPAYEHRAGKDQIGYWGDPRDSVSWGFRIGKPGSFAVHVTYSCATDCGGSAFDVQVGGKKLGGTTAETGSWSRYRTDHLGEISFDAEGEHILIVQPRSEPRWKSMGLQSVLLKPIE